MLRTNGMNGAMIEQNPFMLSLSKHSSLLFNSLSKFETNLRLDFGFRASDFFAVRPSAKADISLTQSHLRALEPLAVNIDEIVVRAYWTLVQHISCLAVLCNRLSQNFRRSRLGGF